MDVVYYGFHNKQQWDEFNSHLPVLWVQDTTGIFAYDKADEHKLIGAMIFDNWTRTSVQCHLLLLNPLLLRHGFFEACFGYAFGKRGKNIMYAMVPGDNEKSLKIISKLGGTEKCRFENAFKENVDYVIMELKKENCKYITQGEKVWAKV